MISLILTLAILTGTRISADFPSVQRGGCSFLRVDVPNRADQGEGVMYTRLFGNGAIYAVNITTEPEARAAVERFHPKPYVPRKRESAMLNPANDEDDYEPSGYESRVTSDEYEEY